MIRRLIILLLIVGCNLIFPQLSLKNFAFNDSSYKKLLIDGATLELENIIKGNANYDRDIFYANLYKSAEDDVYKELESIIKEKIR